MTIRELIILTLSLFFLYYIITKGRETLDAVIVTNAFSDLRCVSDKENNTLPIIRVIDNKTFQYYLQSLLGVDYNLILNLLL